jgi:hypothetical protein
VVEEEDTLEVRRPKRDSVKEKIEFRAIRFGTDILALILSGSDRFNGWEVNADVDVGRFYLAGDYGFAGRDEKIATGGDYHVEGSYWRVGVDVSILKKDPDRNMLFFGLRYGRSEFSERSVYNSAYTDFSTQTWSVSNPDAAASWGELVAGLRVKVWKEFWMGFTSRLKVGLAVRGDHELSTYYVPGFGGLSQGYTWGFNYQLYWRIPFKKQKAPGEIPPP